MFISAIATIQRLADTDIPRAIILAYGVLVVLAFGERKLTMWSF